jgi:hypothetical protein
MSKPRLFHVSDIPGIARFEPRPPPSPDAGVTADAVWAVAQSHLVNYLTPRDCPRIAYRARPETCEEDRERFLSGAQVVVAIEAAWLARLQAATLHVYEMPPATFELTVPEAGYWISRSGVSPLGCEVKSDLVEALTSAGAELRLLQDFWPLAEAVAASSLEFSILRKRNARSRSG